MILAGDLWDEDKNYIKVSCLKDWRFTPLADWSIKLTAADFTHILNNYDTLE